VQGRVIPNSRKVKHDVNGRRQTAKITSDLEFFPSTPTAKVSFLPFTVCSKRHA